MADAPAGKSRLAGDAEWLQRGAGRYDDSARRQFAVAGDEPPTVAVARETLQGGRGEFRAGGSGLLLRHRAEIVARNAVGMTGDAFDPLDAQKLPAEQIAGEYERLAAKLGRDHAGRQSGNAAARNDDVECVAHDPKYRSRMLR